MTSNIVVLRLSPSLLRRFPSSSSSSSSDLLKPNTEMPKDKEASPASSMAEQPVPPSDNASDAASTPAGAPAAETPRRKGLPGPKPGSKRGLNPTDSVPKPRAKPGPKKKQKLDDGAVEAAQPQQPQPQQQQQQQTQQQQQPKVGSRLGPKANTGAINAHLRALDRTGSPCRKWERKPFQLKSFTGVQWHLPRWRAPQPPKGEEENGESKVNLDVSGLPSEKSNSRDGDLTPPAPPPPMAEASSPAIPMAS